jgi:hypothetical protein
MRDRRQHFAFLAPMSLLPVPVDLLTDLLFGALDFTTWINVSVVARSMVARGFADAVLSNLRNPRAHSCGSAWSAAACCTSLRLRLTFER